MLGLMKNQLEYKKIPWGIRFVSMKTVNQNQYTIRYSR